MCLATLSQYFDIYRSVVTNSKKESVGCTVKPVLSGHSKTDKTKILKTNGSLMKVKVLQNALLEHSAILLTCIRR